MVRAFVRITRRFSDLALSDHAWPSVRCRARTDFGRRAHPTSNERPWCDKRKEAGQLRRNSAHRVTKGKIQRALDVLDPAAAAHRLLAETVDNLAAIGGAVVDHDDKPIAPKGEWPGPVDVRLVLGEPHRRMDWLLLGPRPDGEPCGPRAVAELEGVCRLAGHGMAIGAVAALGGVPGPPTIPHAVG
jgi:hypothetical protein